MKIGDKVIVQNHDGTLGEATIASFDERTGVALDASGQPILNPVSSGTGQDFAAAQLAQMAQD